MLSYKSKRSKLTQNQGDSKWKKNLVWVFFMQKYYDKIQSVLLDNFIKRIRLISEELSSGVYVRGFFMWHWLDPARRYSTPIHKVSYGVGMKKNA